MTPRKREKEINEEEVRKLIVERISPYINAHPLLANAINVEEVAEKSIKAYYDLADRLIKAVENAEKRLEVAKRDVELAQKELELRTADPIKFILKTAEEITISRLDALRYVILKQKKAFENGASTILKRQIKNY